MSSVSRLIADALVASDGRYRGDPQVYSIWEYSSKWNTKAYKLFYKPGQVLDESEYTRAPNRFWRFSGDTEVVHP